jgi:hypothetical protein
MGAEKARAIPPPSMVHPDPLTELVIRGGRRRLLDVFRDFVPDVPDSALDAEALTGLVAFLQSVLPFARWEEGYRSPGTDIAEDLAFEHTFLAIEIDGLAKAVALLRAASTSTQRAVSEAATWRRLNRLEAVFELHASKLEDRPVFAPADACPVAAGGSEKPGVGVTTLNARAASDFLRSRSWGILSTLESGSAAPYAVPVSFGWEGGVVLLACSPGRKTRNLEHHPEACLTVVEASNGDHWTSVVIRGRVNWLTGPLERLRAAVCIHAQRGPTLLSPKDLLRFGRARIARLDPHEISARSRG